MKKGLITMSTIAALAACTATPLAAQAKEMNGQWIVINNQETVKEILQDLSEKCGINLDFLFQGSCPDTPEVPAPDETQPEPPAVTPAPDVTQPELPAPTPSAPETSVPDSQPPVTEDEAETPPAESVHPYVLRIVELVNEEREKAGLNPVTLDAAASSAAMLRSREIVSSFSHTRPNGSSFSTALKEQGISYRRAGENIAWGQRSPEQVMEGWMNSSGHRANILGESFTHIGVGYHQENGVNYWTQLFYN